MILEIKGALPSQKWLQILNDSKLREQVITRRYNTNNFMQLTQRELQCLSLISQGMSVKIVSDHLYLSPETVNTHAKSIRQKLGCSNITQAVAKAFRLGLLV
ncbi:response regulator transcription factor [Legionella anisa]|uniref:response regulator transcription factor n=1 Tax=Legionella anisa TaxID=28082 RepID=UPI001F5F5CFC|nr:helix-turn-helix transcriptional regulator [Legionella anisa]